MKTYTIVHAFVFFTINLIGQGTPIASTAYDWKDLVAEPIEHGEQKIIYDGSSDGFNYTDAKVFSIRSMKSSKWTQVPKSSEQLLIIKEGDIKYITKKESIKIGAGSVVLVLPEDEYKIENNSQTMASYYIIRWKSVKGGNATFEKGNRTIVKDWNDVEYVKNAKGGRRNIIREPTSLLREFEMHVTTLNEGEKSHDPHTHIEEEIILVRFGDVEELIDGIPHQVGPGSLIFLRSNIPHGIRNIGKGPCEYYAFKWKIPVSKGN